MLLIWWRRVVISITGIFWNILTSRGEFCSLKTGIPGGPAHQEMRYPNVTWRITLYDYLFTTELRHTCTSGIFSLKTRTCYISNGHKLSKNALCIVILSTFRVSSINYLFIYLSVYLFRPICGLQSKKYQGQSWHYGYNTTIAWTENTQ